MSIIAGLKKFHQTLKTWSWHHAVVFVLTFLSYAFFHCCRKAFSNIKNTWDETYSPYNDTYPLYPYEIWQKETLFATSKKANVFLGELDSLFLFAYAIGLYISGIIGDRVNLRYMLSFGMCGSAILTMLFGYMSEVLHIRNLWYYRIFNFLNGLCQSTGWPASVAIMGNWFSKSSGGLVFGIWSANASTGNIIGSIIVASILDYGYGYGMLMNSVILFCGGVIVFFCLVVHPNEVGLENPDDTVKKESDDDGSLDDHKVKQQKAIGFFRAFLIPGVLAYALSYACLKLVNYSFFFWLPTYLSQGLGWDDSISDKLSNFYDLGGILGGIVAGVVSDILGVRSPPVAIMLILSAGSVYLYGNAGGGYSLNVVLMVVTGFFIGGPANTISTAITADLGKHKSIQGSTEALATVTGIIDGTGSAGAAIGQYLVGVIDDDVGWHAVFYFLIGMLGASLLCIAPMIYNDIKNIAVQRRTKKELLAPLLSEES